MAGDVGTWSSSSPVVSMMAVSGIGIASRIGTSIVAYTVGELTTNTEVGPGNEGSAWNHEPSLTSS